MLENPQMVAGIKQFCMEVWAIIPPKQRERLIDNYRKCLVGVIVAKRWHNQLLSIRGQLLFHTGALGVA
jgi:hypothetical protein